MIRLERLNCQEHDYIFEDATAAAEYANGTFGTVTSGVFTAGAGTKAIVQVEDGDDAYSDKFTVKAGEHVRVADFTAAPVGEIVNITADELPASYAVGNKLKAAATGKLTVNATGALFEVIEVTRYGVRAKTLAQTQS